MARREAPTRDILKANMQKIQGMYEKIRVDETQKDKEMKSDPYTDFQEQLTCVVCFELASEPFSCPKCQHICCRPCLDQWFSTPTSGPAAVANQSRKICPGCRTDLAQTEIHTNRLADSLVTAMRSSERLYCKKHDGSEVLFFCQTCDAPLCSDAIVDEPVHRSHSFAQLNKIYAEAKSKIDSLLEHFTDFSYECQTEIVLCEKLLIEERYKNEVKLAEFMKTVDEQLQQFQADEERECARLHKLVRANQDRMAEIKTATTRIETKFEALSKVEIVRTADVLIQEIQSSLASLDENNIKSVTKPRHKDSDEL